MTPRGLRNRIVRTRTQSRLRKRNQVNIGYVHAMIYQRQYGHKRPILTREQNQALSALAATPGARAFLEGKTTHPAHKYVLSVSKIFSESEKSLQYIEDLRKLYRIMKK